MATSRRDVGLGWAEWVTRILGVAERLAKSTVECGTEFKLA
jgi:hypothetical protein